MYTQGDAEMRYKLNKYFFNETPCKYLRSPKNSEYFCTICPYLNVIVFDIFILTKQIIYIIDYIFI